MGNIEPGPIRQRGLLRPISQSGSDPEKNTLFGSDPGRAATPHRISRRTPPNVAQDGRAADTDGDKDPRTDSTDGDRQRTERHTTQI